MLPEQALWQAYISRIVEDAIYPFSIIRVDGKTGLFVPIDKQYEHYASGKKKYKRWFTAGITSQDHHRAINIIECESFLDVCIDAGYDSLFVRKTRDFVQKANEYKKTLDRMCDDGLIKSKDTVPKQKKKTKPVSKRVRKKAVNYENIKNGTW